MTTTIRETDLLAVYESRLRFARPTTEIWTEQLYSDGPIRLKLDMVVELEDDAGTKRLIVIVGKDMLDKTAIQQAFDLQGLSDQTVIVCRKPERKTDQHERLVEIAYGMGVGVSYIVDNRCIERVAPGWNADAQPWKLREQLRHREQELAAGIACGGTNAQTEWLRKIEAEVREAGSIKTSLLERLTGEAPFKSLRVALNFIKTSSREGHTRLRVQDGYLTTK